MLKESALVLAATGAAATVVYLYLNMKKTSDTSKSSAVTKEEFLVLKDPSPQPTTTQEPSITSNQNSDDSVEVIDFQPEAAESLEQELEAASKSSENQTSQSRTFEGGEEGSPLTTASNEDSMIIINPEDLNSSSPDVQQIEFK